MISQSWKATEMKEIEVVETLLCGIRLGRDYGINFAMTAIKSIIVQHIPFIAEAAAE